ncbi:hypothetical protein P3T36_000272 [Kitasatospora sp. MAP12-15]|uniref:hypothetical protein n=1 Tax=unclassified Kitasatospora TaxID=2633591 RepID=UPI002476C09A|nr:hypothetical protein [Kitasatospora sp. MAP12-44]MDH6109501.1 hypothetical protein [Kitasatospora sp. MAP12-44]
MRITATRGTHTVTIELDGSSPALLRQAEAAALRLLGDPTEPAAKAPIGFTGDSPTPTKTRKPG